MTDARKLLAYTVFPSLSAVGFYGSFILSIRNGLWDHLWTLVRGADVPGSRQKIIQTWTGIKPVDDYLAFYVAYFLPKSQPALALQQRHFITQYVAMWSLLQMKGGPLASLILGFGVQTFGAGGAVPLFCAYDLLYPSKDVPTTPLSALSILGIIGAAVSSHKHRQAWLVVWQVYYLISEPLSVLLPQTSSTTIYTFVECLSTISHLAVIVVALISKVTPILGFKDISFIDMFWPKLNIPAGDMMDARLNFMRWDEGFANISIVLWALARYMLARKGLDMAEAMRLSAKVIIRALLMGPAGAAAWVLRQEASLPAVTA